MEKARASKLRRISSKRRASLVGVIPQVLKFAGIFLQVVEFSLLVTVIDDDFVASVPVHRGIAALVLRPAGDIGIESPIVFAADEVSMLMRRGFPAKNGKQ